MDALFISICRPDTGNAIARVPPFARISARFALPPANDGPGGPFTIGRVIHKSPSGGFTGYIDGVAALNRALNAEDLGRLSAFKRALVILPSAGK